MEKFPSKHVLESSQRDRAVGHLCDSVLLRWSFDIYLERRQQLLGFMGKSHCPALLVSTSPSSGTVQVLLWSLAETVMLKPVEPRSGVQLCPDPSERGEISVSSAPLLGVHTPSTVRCVQFSCGRCVFKMSHGFTSNLIQRVELKVKLR